MTEAEDKEKAEKVAAAKKRYEQLKKQKAKKAGGAAKKKDDKGEAEAEASTSAEKADEAGDGAEALVEEKEPEEPPEAMRPSHARQPSVTLESRLRSDSFRRNANQPNPLSPTVKSPTLPPLSPGGDAVGDIYRKQALRIEELEKENKRLQIESSEAEKRWKKTEEELEELREASGEVAELKSKADQAATKGEEVEKLKSEVQSLQRQNAHLQTQTTKSRRISTSSPSHSTPEDLAAQLASKSATIESLELEISNLNAQLTQSATVNTTQLTQISALESALAKAEQSAAASARELSDLKKNLERASERARAELLEKKVETLTTLHRESDARTQARQRDAQKTEREVAELRTRVTGLSNENARLREAEQRRRKAEVQGVDDGGVQELVDEERERLAARVRELEEEVFELRRGVWRDRRREIQPAIEEALAGPANSGFDEVDLSGGQSPRRGNARGSSFQDVISSGISAFTGQPRRGSVGARSAPRKQSVGLLSDDDDFEFDEDAFRAAQEEEARKRIERVREVKRGLKTWENWRIDIVDIRAGVGGVFEV
ncbi:hypothetical protein AOQ84DRAFT_431397 [Glonium stellatum]|uniref:M protein repeat protein n=1 Tax=Glonium stellatum TaxID=574774 RepID=A0A8E2F3G5_9PEZI|nr:hypothetical protein AOQ84DRAFT_431397 [Glonium stellatum]